MKVNYKQMYAMLKQQRQSLVSQLNPEQAADKVNEIPENFNTTGWDTTIEKVELMLEKMKKLKEIKGTRLTPQFYRSIYNRALIASGEADKLIESLTEQNSEIDYEVEVIALNAEIAKLHTELAEKKTADAKALEDAKKAETKEGK